MIECQQCKVEKKEVEDDEDFGFVNLKLCMLYLDIDGFFYFVGEQYYVIINYNLQIKLYIYMYYYKDMFLIKINVDGMLGFMRKMVKNQIVIELSGGIGFSIGYNCGYDDFGFKFLMIKKNVYLVYVDNLKNLNLEMNQVLKRYQFGKGGFVISYQINKELGSVVKLFIFDLRNVKGIDLFQFFFECMVNIEDNVFGLECYKKKKEDVMVRIDIND